MSRIKVYLGETSFRCIVRIETVTMASIVCMGVEIDFIQFVLAKAQSLKTVMDSSNEAELVTGKEVVMSDILEFQVISNEARVRFNICFWFGNQILFAYMENPLLLTRTTEQHFGCRRLQVVQLDINIAAVPSRLAILTASPDCSIVATDIESGKEVARLKKAHGAAVNKLVNLTETTIASGDDAGCIKVWDTRQSTCCNSFDADEELVSEATYISDMTFVPDSLHILASSGDGMLSLCSLRKNKVQARSEFAEDALLSVVMMKNGRKVVCGTESGALLLYSWGHLEDCSDRFLGHTQPVEALLKVDEDTVISGSNDGIIRLVGILPNKIIQPLAEHSEYPIEGLAFSHDRKYLGSVSHDQMLKLWNLQELLDGKQDAPNTRMAETDSDDGEMDVDMNMPEKPINGNKPKKAGKSLGSTSSAADFFAGMED